ncbi:MAG: hypothetical protein U0636_05420 [Phycisphaerales bacterium]
MRFTRPHSLAACALLASAALAAPVLADITTFEDGTNGWGVFHDNDGTLGDFLLPSGGNPNGNLQFRMVDTWGANLHNTTNASVLGDYSRFSGGVELSVDVKVNNIVYDPFFDGGLEVERHMVVELVQYNAPGSEYPFTSVYYDLGTISSWATGDWTHFSVTIADPTSTALPAGWGGTGAEDPVTYEPILPPGATFASVLANVDEIRFTTLQPGWFYGFTYFDLQYDNVGVQAVPGPGVLALSAAAGVLGSRRRRS